MRYLLSSASLFGSLACVALGYIDGDLRYLIPAMFGASGFIVLWALPDVLDYFKVDVEKSEKDYPSPISKRQARPHDSKIGWASAY